MKKIFGSTSALHTAIGIVVLMGGTGGCATNPAEAEGRSSSKLLAPHPVFSGAATADTTALLGIAEWRIYRGKTAYIVTGYDAAGNAVSGVKLSFSGVTHAFSGATRAAKPSLSARMLDGSKFSAIHEYGSGTTEVNEGLGTTSYAFAFAMLRDMDALRATLKTSITSSAVTSGEACSGDMVKVASSSLVCMMTASASGNLASLNLQQCVAAAGNASKATVSCKNAALHEGVVPGGALGPDPSLAQAMEQMQQMQQTQAPTPADNPKELQDIQNQINQLQTLQPPMSSGEKQNEKMDMLGDPSTPTPTPTPTPTGAPTDDAPQVSDASAGADAQVAASDQTCASCQGSADVGADPSTGEVFAEADTPDDTG